MTIATIVRLAARGDGATNDGRHLPLTAPGDKITDAGEIVAGPHHVVPPCRHFPRCGGCQLQHVDDTAYADFLIERVTGALASQGLGAPEIRVPHLSPPRTRRRASLRVERIGRQVVIGFNEAASHRIVDMRECHILLPQLFALVGPLRALMGQLLAPRRKANVALTWTDQGADVAIEGVTVEGLSAQEALIAFAAEQQLARLSIDEGYGSEPRWEPEPVTVTLGGSAVGLPVRGFLQATADGEEALTAAVREAIGGSASIADLFAGLGTFALAMADGARVLAIEGARDAALALRTAAGRSRSNIAICSAVRWTRPNSAGSMRSSSIRRVPVPGSRCPRSPRPMSGSWPTSPATRRRSRAMRACWRMATGDCAGSGRSGSSAGRPTSNWWPRSNAIDLPGRLAFGKDIGLISARWSHAGFLHPVMRRSRRTA